MRNTEYLGPSMPISEEIDRMKYQIRMKPVMVK